MNAIKDLNKKIDTTLKKQEAETAKAQAGLQKARAKLPPLRDALEQATTAGNPEEYSRTKAELTQALDATEMYEKRLEQLQERPLVSEEEGQKEVQRVLDFLEKDTETKKEQVAQILTELARISTEINDTRREASAVISKWCADVCREPNNGIMLLKADHSLPVFLNQVLHQETARTLLANKK